MQARTPPPLQKPVLKSSNPGFTDLQGPQLLSCQCVWRIGEHRMLSVDTCEGQGCPSVSHAR